MRGCCTRPLSLPARGSAQESPPLARARRHLLHTSRDFHARARTGYPGRGPVASPVDFHSIPRHRRAVRWLRELVASLCGGSAVMPRLRVVYPTRAQVGASLEGWVAGASIPCQTANAAKLRSVLQQLSGASAFARLCGWDGGPSGRAAAVPHIKSYALYTDEGRLGWAMLTSSNLSQARLEPCQQPTPHAPPPPDPAGLARAQAAWGKLEKGGTQLYIKSYELGVLVLPSLQPAGRQSLVATSAAPLVGEESATLVPLPYTLPPTPCGPPRPARRRRALGAPEHTLCQQVRLERRRVVHGRPHRPHRVPTLA